MPELRPTPAVAVVVLRPDEILLVRRAKEPSRGRWSFPGGSVELWETAREAARREVREETGIEVRVLDVVEIFDAIVPATADHPGFHYCIAEFLAVPADDAEPVPATDALDARWVGFRDLERYEISDAMKAILAKALEIYRRPTSPGTGARHP